MKLEPELINLTKQYGGDYGINHSKRILNIIDTIGKNYSFDSEVVHISVYLHDWGGYSPWKKDGIDHAERSVEVARDYLADKIVDTKKIEHIIECIANHHNGRKDKSIEAQLISDADGIDYIGTIGIVREFSTKPRELRKAFEFSQARMEKVKQNICIKESRIIVEERIERMKRIFTQLIEETDNVF